MNYTKLQQTIKDISSKDLEQRKGWYSPAAEAYNSARPKYPSELVDKVVNAAQLTQSSRILEIGSGPGTATASFTQLGCQMVCIEPNPDFCELAKKNCESYPSVEVINTSFEEWDLEHEAFDAVLAASSMHWIPSEIGYTKASSALKEDGYLILLWNKELQPCKSMQKAFSSLYQLHAPSLGRYEDRETQEDILAGLGQMMLDSGRFRNLVTATVETSLTYTSDQYISLLSTYSSYLKLDHRTRNALFAGLRLCILTNGADEIPLSYLSTYHISRKM
ncbi:bifunctional 2-polyprenyl-6-hydroxyphenol methylase/3-demethylubiquinol 3-O-methyltransferase UbiG [Cyanobium sp. Lug-B]|uniref:class I SAM-dependent methyltransferase n=1 Tax=Cyanobium sp. Lug-B TaxID=2823716 RepID=UPI0020CCBAF1|nr:class I SAM-dependent methyltransferase [Cyanobium sp. Lug-B]MCP9797398.1 class I SAM-dependent methyltransferase [Cyanobium sp. Lug-B]